jgi:ribosomal-protein-alanine N-acetyltransferase
MGPHRFFGLRLKCLVDFILRDFQGVDFKTLWWIDQTCFPPGIAYTQAELKDYVTAAGVFTLVAETSSENAETADVDRNGGGEHGSLVDSSIVGFIVAQTNRSGIGHIVTIDVLPEGRRSGIGSRLLAAAEERLRSAHCRRVRLEAAVDNIAAQEFYRRQGYAVTKTIRGYYSNGADAFVLMKDL